MGFALTKYCVESLRRITSERRTERILIRPRTTVLHEGPLRAPFRVDRCTRVGKGDVKSFPWSVLKFLNYLFVGVPVSDYSFPTPRTVPRPRVIHTRCLRPHPSPSDPHLIPQTTPVPEWSTRNVSDHTRPRVAHTGLSYLFQSLKRVGRLRGGRVGTSLGHIGGGVPNSGRVLSYWREGDSASPGGPGHRGGGRTLSTQP